VKLLSRDVVEVEGLAFVSGKVGDLNSVVVAGGAGQETTQALKNLAASLQAVGLQLSDVIKVIVYLTNIGAWDEMNESYLAAFEEPLPARSSVGVAALPLGAHIQIDAIAYRKR
jgi:2-iminobutanoate/2-iminopropanoate deaminase